MDATKVTRPRPGLHGTGATLRGGATRLGQGGVGHGRSGLGNCRRGKSRHQCRKPMGLKGGHELPAACYPLVDAGATDPHGLSETRLHAVESSQGIGDANHGICRVHDLMLGDPNAKRQHIYTAKAVSCLDDLT